MAVTVFCCFLIFGGSSQIFAENAELEESNQTDLEEQKAEEENKDKADAKEEKVDDLQEDLEKIKKEKEQDVQKKLIISEDIQQISANINFIETEISKSEDDLRVVEGEIIEKQRKITHQKEIIAEILRGLDQINQEVDIIAINSGAGFDEYFAAVDSLQQLGEKLYDAMEQMKAQKADLDLKRQDQAGVMEMQSDQRKTLQYEKNKKNVMLGQAQKEISQKDAEIGEIQSKIAKLRADITRLLGKGYDAKDIEDAAAFASKASGVRKDFLMGMLVIESDLGRYTGGCGYKESRMSESRKKLFKEICSELDYDYKKQKVSCPPSGYSGTGGAMGVAQFMSDTWMGYKSSIAAATGHNPPDPWNLTDGVTAMGLKLAKGGATSKKGECNAAKLYLSGTTSSKYDWYCDKVLYWADNYEKLIGS